MEGEKNKAIMNCGDDYDDILDIQYGRKGTPSRDRFDREAEAFILAERLKEERRKAGLTQEYLPHREREDGRAAIDSLQDISGTGQAGQHHHPVVQAAPFIQHHAVSSRNGVVGSKTHVSVPLVPLVPLRKPLSVCSG